MNLNFKHYNTGALISFVFVSYFLLIFICNQIGQIIGELVPPSFASTLDQIKEFANVLSPTFLLGVILAWIDKSLWKYTFMNWLIDIPDLSGRYVGEGQSSYQNTLMDCVYEITQTASILHINAYFRVKGSNSDSSSGEMRSGELIKQTNGSYKVYFIYENKENRLDPNSKDHQGASVLTYFPDTKTLQGDYFNSRPNQGNIKVTFKQEKLLYRFE